MRKQVHLKIFNIVLSFSHLIMKMALFKFIIFEFHFRMCNSMELGALVNLSNTDQLGFYLFSLFCYSPSVFCIISLLFIYVIYGFIYQFCLLFPKLHINILLNLLTNTLLKQIISYFVIFDLFSIITNK